MNNVNKTLYIPLYGKAYVSKKGLFIDDKMAEKIWEKEGFTLKGKSASKWLAYYMGIRSAVFDQWVKGELENNSGAVVIHLGCGLDSRAMRIGNCNAVWYDVDFPEVIEERKKYFRETDKYKMISSDVRRTDLFNNIKSKRAIVVMEGISMYLTPSELQNLLLGIGESFEEVSLLMDCYTTLAAKMSKVKNPINDVGVTLVYGTDDPKDAESGGICFVKELDMTPEDLCNKLVGFEGRIFKRLYAGNFSKKLYKLYEYKKG